MKNNYNGIELTFMLNLISDYISKKECDYDMNCKHCEYIDDCYMKASDKCNIEFAESIGYGGCNTEEEFWEQLFS